MTASPANQRALQGVGYIPQGRDVFPDLTVRANLLLGEAAGKGRTAPDYYMTYRVFPFLKARALFHACSRMSFV